MADGRCDFRFTVQMLGRDVLVLSFSSPMSRWWRRKVREIAIKAFARARHKDYAIHYRFPVGMNADIQRAIVLAQQDAKKRYGHG